MALRAEDSILEWMGRKNGYQTYTLRELTYVTPFTEGTIRINLRRMETEGLVSRTRHHMADHWRLTAKGWQKVMNSL